MSGEVRRALAFRQPFFNRPHRNLCARGKAQLSQNIAHVHFGGSFANHPEISDLPARLALSNECCDFTFTFCYTAKRLPGSLSGERRFFLWEGVKRRAFELVAQGCISDGCRKLLDELPPRSIFLPSLIFVLEELICSSQRPMDGPQDRPSVARHCSPFRIL